MGSAPPNFRAIPFEQALAQARADGVWLIVAATSESSPECDLMDRATWSDSRVVSWIEQRKALAIRIDVDTEPQAARALEVQRVPTLIVFRDGAEKDRSVGFMDGTGLLMWLGGVDEGIKEMDFGQGANADPEQDVEGRESYAEALLRAQDYAKATDLYVWLWNNMARIRPASSGVRVSFMALEIEELVRAHPEGRRQFGELRDQAGAAADADPRASAERRDWVVLNRCLGDEDRTIAWFDAVKADPGAARLVDWLSTWLTAPLKARGRWADLGRLYQNPLAELANDHRMSRLMGPFPAALFPADMKDRYREVAAQRFRDAAAELFASLRAAGRNEDAQAVHDEALRLDPSPEMRAALDESPVRYH